ncbi:chemotaxis response regulator protein-glutamate methylesterase [Stakelama sediminis]|uniref:Protein-glutamate methylesterase/protein-glutamine glutaminase n=1 Tax=Stakelama sediminis TaxID=463200 RepID=A0A840YU37_9SPHN|nr:chemotaxis response regulator protein-glutamate methylesterase [Stakelama sediminis]MBB5717102.1 two-component system chemotaxis response regulator CheB [Stakelama sediminis]
MTIRVLIVDDSKTMQAVLRARLSREADIEVVATAGNAAEARQLMRELDPDVVTLDIEMPGMNGLDFLEKIMRLRPTPVIVVSSAAQAGTESAARALALGAVDCYAKADRFGAMGTEDNGKLASLIRQAAQIRFDQRAPSIPKVSVKTQKSIGGDTRLIAIGSSTGGVEALQILLRDFPADCPPTMIVQHINVNFAAAVARRLDSICKAKVLLAEPDMPIRRGQVYFAPGGDRHMMLGGTENWFVKLRQGDLVSGHRPSVDALFRSIAPKIRGHVVGVLMTGMGSDGARGLLEMAQAGATTIAQNEASCTVFGMPRAAIELGAAGVVAPLDRIAEHALSRAA